MILLYPGSDKICDLLNEFHLVIVNCDFKYTFFVVLVVTSGFICWLNFLINLKLGQGQWRLGRQLHQLGQSLNHQNCHHYHLWHERYFIIVIITISVVEVSFSSTLFNSRFISCKESHKGQLGLKILNYWIKISL